MRSFLMAVIWGLRFHIILFGLQYYLLYVDDIVSVASHNSYGNDSLK